MWGWLLTAPATAQELPFTHYTPDSELNPLPAAGVTDVYQDTEGYLWMTILSAGLVRYDGQVLEHYGYEDGLVDVNTDGLLQDATGHLWVSSVGGLAVSREPLAAYEHGRRVRFTDTWGGVDLPRSLTNNKSIAADADGAVWVGTSSDGIVRYRIDGPATMVVDTFRTDVRVVGEHDPAYALVARRDGSVWAGLSDGRLLAGHGATGRVEPVETQGDALDATTTVMYEDAAGTLWGGTHDGSVWRLVDGSPPYLEMVDTVLEEWIEDIVETPDGRLWVTSLGAGLRRLDPEDPHESVTYGRQDGLLSNTLNGGVVDREGNLWIGSDQGVSRLRFDHEAFGHYTATSYGGEQPALPAATVTSVVTTEGPSGRRRLWAGTTGGVALLRPGRPSAFVRLEHGLSSALVYTLEKDAAGRIWIGSNGPTGVLLPAGTSLPVPRGGSVRSLPHLEGEWRLAQVDLGNVYVIERLPLPVDESGQLATDALWFLSYRKISCLVEGTWFTFRQEAGFPATASGAATVDDRGYLWVGTDSEGLLRSRFPLSLERLRTLAASEEGSGLDREIQTPVLVPAWTDSLGATVHNVQALARHDGLLWVGTPHGIYALRDTAPDVVAHLTTSDGLPSDNVMSMDHSRATGTLWAGTNQGLVEIDPASRRVVRVVTRRDGLLSGEAAFHESVRAEADGTVYFGTPRGLSVYRPHLDRSNALPPILHLRHVRFVDDPWGQNEFTVRYAALSLADEASVRYRTRLLGYRETWSEETGDVTAHFTNLSAFLVPRTYTFEVVASNSDGVWVEHPVAYSFAVRPAWWLRWWAWLGYALAFAGLIAGALRYQHRRIERSERERALLREKELRAEAAEAWANYLQSENERQMQELEAARTLQLSMLPKALPDHPTVALAASMQTAAEVGGDYYDAEVSEGGTLTVVIGDATGHGTKAGTMVTAAKTLWHAFVDVDDITSILKKSSAVLRRMGLPKLYMALALARVEGYTLELAGAGMPPALLYRASTGRVERIPLKGLPLGSPASYPYTKRCVSLAPGDTVVMMTDGFPELFNDDGEMLGYERAIAIVEEVADRSPEAIVEWLVQACETWMSGRPHDDVTFVVMKVKA